jgi:hypothetical protein
LGVTDQLLSTYFAWQNESTIRQYVRRRVNFKESYDSVRREYCTIFS